MFGTERQCRKHFVAWKPNYKIEVRPGKFKALFPSLFNKAIETDNWEIKNFNTTFDLVNILIAKQGG